VPAAKRRTTAASPTTAVTSSESTSGLLIFDGDCGFCTSSAHWFDDRLNESGRIAPWQGLDLDEYGLSEQDVTTAAYWVEDGVSHRGPDGFVLALGHTNGIWKLAGKILGVPPVLWLAHRVYPIIAKYRHKLPGATEACRMPSSYN